MIMGAPIAAPPDTGTKTTIPCVVQTQVIPTFRGPKKALEWLEGESTRAGMSADRFAEIREIGGCRDQKSERIDAHCAFLGIDRKHLGV